VSLGEFALIDRYFSRTRGGRADVGVGVGDDAAVLLLPPGTEAFVAAATASGGPTLADAPPPADLAHGVLAQALGGIAAAGATPRWLTLALTLPAADASWLAAFSESLFALAGRFDLELVGGDTTGGPVSVTVHVQGWVPEGQATPCEGARPGDLVYVSGWLGDAALALLARREEIRIPVRDREAAERRLTRPEPRLALGAALRGVASAATDLPRGLAQDLAELLARSGVGATLYGEQLPISPTLRAHLVRAGGWSLPFAAGGDGELLFTIPADRQGEVAARLTGLDPGLTWVGTVERARGLRCLLADGTDLGS
jgi:thiamine-monophosphate kinase